MHTCVHTHGALEACTEWAQETYLLKWIHPLDPAGQVTLTVLTSSTELTFFIQKAFLIVS